MGVGKFQKWQILVHISCSRSALFIGTLLHEANPLLGGLCVWSILARSENCVPLAISKKGEDGNDQFWRPKPTSVTCLENDSLGGVNHRLIWSPFLKSQRCRANGCGTSGTSLAPGFKGKYEYSLGSLVPF